jgi:hypothetical protein
VTVQSPPPKPPLPAAPPAPPVPVVPAPPVAPPVPVALLPPVPDPLLTLAPAPAGTVLTWEEFYDGQDLAAARASFDDGLADIGRRLVERFGGRSLERYTDAPL